MELHHVIEAQQFDLPMIHHLFEVAAEMEKVVARGGTDEISSSTDGHTLL